MIPPAFFRPILCLCLFVLLAVCPAEPARALDVTGVRIGTHGAKTRVVIETSGSTAFRASMLADPIRLAIDLPAGKWRAKGIDLKDIRTVRQIRQGATENGQERIIFNLGETALIDDAFALPAGKGSPDRIVIDFSPASSSRFAKEKTKIYGTLTSAGAAGAPVAPQSQARSSRVPEGDSVVPDHIPLIVVDAGHGGIDPGTSSSNGLHEKNITLAMAKDLKEHLEATGRYRVLLTRSTDVFIPLGGRVAIARQHHADLFVSLHADSISRRVVSGASIYTLSETASDKESAKLADRENGADAIGGINLHTQDQDVATILVDLAMRDTMNQSKFLANSIVQILRANGIATLDLAHRFAGFAVLKAPDIPSILIELGYMSNAQEASRLNSDAYRDRLANALVTGIDRYFATVRHNGRR